MAKDDANRSTCLRKTSIGGQALIEGLMMIGPEKKAMACRLPNGEIKVEYLNMRPPYKLEKVPLIRGCIRLVRQMSLGMRAMMRSAELSELTEGEKDEQGKVKKQGFLDRHPQLMLALSVVISLVLTVVTFILLPNILAEGLRRLLNWQAPLSWQHQFALNLVEGVLRIVVFIGYLALSGLNKQIHRVWQYHGSEHKTIACYEARQELTVENVRKMSRLHPRCGTSFMLLVMIVAVIVMSCVGWQSAWLNVLYRILLLPLIAGVSYEIIRQAGAHDTALWSRIISGPGLKMQLLTTAEPDDSMLEVSIAAMQAVLPADEAEAAWTN